MTNKNLTRRNFITLTSKGVIISAILPSALGAFAKSSNYQIAKNKNFNKFTSDPNEYINQMKKFTDTYKKYSIGPTALREVECLRVQYPILLCDIQDEDLFAGRDHKPAIGFAPQSLDSFGYYMQEREIKSIMESSKTTSESKGVLLDLINFWKVEASKEKLRKLYPTKMKEVLFSDNYASEPLIAAPLYRMGGTQCDFDKLITLGVGGLRKEVSRYKTKSTRGSERYFVYEGMEKSCDLFAEVAVYYAGMATQQAFVASPDRKKELLVMEKVLYKIASGKPETFREAIQLMFLYATLSGTINYGRMDEYLGDLYVNGLAKGTLTEEEAIDLLSGLWELISNTGDVYNARVIIGGRGRRNEKNADRFALIAMETTQRVKGIVPQLTLRFYKGQNQALYKKGIDMIATGNPYPMIYNDEVNIPAVMNAFQVTYEEAINYVPYGCGEYVLYHRSVGTPSGLINLLQALSVTLHNGKNPITSKQMGLSVSKLGNFDIFDNLFNAYKKNVELYIEQLAYQEKLEYDVAGQVAPFLFLSMVFDDCIKRGKGIFKGGVRYLGGTLESYGNTNTADSLVAIKKLVYDEKKFSLEQMVTMVDADFKGFEKERKMMLDAPKYGNDDDYADNIKVEVDRHVCSFARSMNVNAGLHSYLIVIINNSTNTILGKQTAASPDGRKAFTYMANANAPVGGADKNGVTAFLNSIVKPDVKIHAGAVQNMKFSKDMFGAYRPKTEALLKTYWEKGGAQCMINCLGREDLENAMKHPEQYANLIVRVGGFSAKFVELSKDVQLEILSRTMY